VRIEKEFTHIESSPGKLENKQLQNKPQKKDSPSSIIILVKLTFLSPLHRATSTQNITNVDKLLQLFKLII